MVKAHYLVLADSLEAVYDSVYPLPVSLKGKIKNGPAYREVHPDRVRYVINGVQFLDFLRRGPTEGKDNTQTEA